ncbi:efflux RND transporter periplasmic adaptor subunit [Albibacillus kandeliae]|uniref:efflux RND transporter periplasmic adaptor subunit n=1 Tax=Albibacillus kandeliae TaxID=2174228 RepID=UPI000D691366|nr:efflux RND transporter periplasmic adaptor subunit [Albibacillus kandeliae]
MRQVLLVTALLGAALAMPASAQDAPPRPVISEIVAPQSGIANSWVGTVTASSEIDLGFLKIGTLAERLVEVGDTVSRGDVLARLDAVDLESELRAAQAGVSIAEANLHTAQDAYDRVKTLADRGVNSVSALEDTRNDLAAAEASLEQARAAEARAEDARDYANLRAPIDGVITSVSADPGSTIASGEAVLTLAAIADREVVIALSEEDATGMAPESEFQVRLLSNPSMLTAATLDRIDPVSSRASRNRDAHLKLSDADQTAFRLGALVTVTLKEGQETIMTVPVSALIGDGTVPEVWRVTPDDRKVQRVDVVTGPQGGGRVVILSGLSVGDEVVTRGVHSLAEGQTVGRRVAPGKISGAGQ